MPIDIPNPERERPDLHPIHRLAERLGPLPTAVLVGAGREDSERGDPARKETAASGLRGSRTTDRR